MKRYDFIKRYEVMTGRSFINLFVFEIVWLILMISIYILFNIIMNPYLSELTSNETFLAEKSPLVSGAVGGGLLVFALSVGSKFFRFRKDDCYFLTIKNRFDSYKTVYLISYFSYCLFITFFVALIYLVALIFNHLPARAYLFFLADIEIILFSFALLPFMFDSKKISILILKSIIPIITYVFLNTIILKTNNILFPVILLAVTIPIIMYLSNHRWLRIMKSVYDDEV